MSKQAMESDFEGMLRRLHPKPEVVAEFPTIAAQAWREHNSDAERRKKELTTELEETKKLKSKLLLAKLNGEVLQSDYEQASAEFSREIDAIQRELLEVDAAQVDADSFRHFATSICSMSNGPGRSRRPSSGCVFEICCSKTV